MGVFKHSGWRLRVAVVVGVGASAVGVTAAYGALGPGDTATGIAALASEAGGDDNTADGYAALVSNTTGSSNTAVGLDSLAANTTGSNNTASGFWSLHSNTDGYENTATGFNALGSNTTGDYNTADGVAAMVYNTTGAENTAAGFFALIFNTTGRDNTAAGFQALKSNTTGNFNAGVGFNALYWNGTGTRNTGIGWDVGNGAHPNKTGSNDTFLGAGAEPGTDTEIDNATAVGANAVVSQSDSLVLGAPGVNVGISTSTPQSRLQIGGGTTDSFGDYLQVPVVVTLAKTPPAADCNTTTFVGRLVMTTSNGKKVTLWACTPTGVWAKA